MALRSREAISRFARSNAAVFKPAGAPPLLEPLGPAERRRHPRHALPCHCWIDADKLTVLGPIQDIGVGGLFVRTAVPLVHGALVDVTLRVGEMLEAFAARALVARVVPVRPGYCHGVGLEFIEVHHGQRVLRSLIEGARAPSEARL